MPTHHRRSQQLLSHARALAASPALPYLILGVALVVRVAWLLAFAPAPASDFAAYYQRAVGLATGLGYTHHHIPTAYFPPGYPALLAGIFLVIGPSPVAVYVVNLLLQLLTVVLIAAVGRRLFASPLAGQLAALLFAVHPNSIAYVGLAASENLFIPLILLGVLCLWEAPRWPWLDAVVGAAIGWAVLTRPQSIAVPLLFLLLLLPAALRERQHGRWLGRVVLVYALVALVVVPWVVRNALLLHRPVLTTTTGINLFIGNNVDADGAYCWTPGMQARLDAIRPRYWAEVDYDAACKQLAMHDMRAHPWQTIARLPWKFWRLFYHDGDGAVWTQEGLPAATPAQVSGLRVAAVLAQLFYVALLAAFAGALIGLRRARPSPFGLLVIGVFTAIYLVYYGAARYHLPMLPWMMLYVGAWAAGAIHLK